MDRGPPHGTRHRSTGGIISPMVSGFNTQHDGTRVPNTGRVGTNGNEMPTYPKVVCGRIRSANVRKAGLEFRQLILKYDLDHSSRPRSGIPSPLFPPELVGQCVTDAGARRG